LVQDILHPLIRLTAIPISAPLLLLPVISRLKIADVEIDIPVELKGNQIYQLMPLPNSILDYKNGISNPVSGVVYFSP
jgi:hypothetical protein